MSVSDSETPTVTRRGGDSGGRGSSRGRRPYRVVFLPAGQAEEGRRGVIVVLDLEAAHREARQIARSGGLAEVLYVGDDGTRVLARYPGSR